MLTQLHYPQQQQHTLTALPPVSQVFCNQSEDLCVLECVWEGGKGIMLRGVQGVKAFQRIIAKFLQIPN